LTPNSQLCNTAPFEYYPDVTKEMIFRLTEARLLHHKEEPVDAVMGNNRNLLWETFAVPCVPSCIMLAAFVKLSE
jgi:hypothetical protein